MSERDVVDVGDWEPRDREGPEREHPPARIEYDADPSAQDPTCGWCGFPLDVDEQQAGEDVCWNCVEEVEKRA